MVNEKEGQHGVQSNKRIKELIQKIILLKMVGILFVNNVEIKKLKKLNNKKGVELNG